MFKFKNRFVSIVVTVLIRLSATITAYANELTFNVPSVKELKLYTGTFYVVSIGETITEDSLSASFKYNPGIDIAVTKQNYLLRGW